MGPEVGKAALWGPGEKLPKGSLAAVYGWTSLVEWSSERGAHQNQEEKPPSPAGSLQHPLLIECNIIPASKGEMFTGSSSITTKQAMKPRFETERQQIDNLYKYTLKNRLWAHDL